MQIYPAINISSGKCIDPSQEGAIRHYLSIRDPLKMAEKWIEEGATYIHITDIDGASSGMVSNGETIVRMARELDVPVQVGGGIRSIKDIDYYLQAGVSRVIIGTKAVENRSFVKDAVYHFGKDKISVCVDACDGMIAVRGRMKLMQYNAFNFASEMKQLGIDTILYSDVLRLGALNNSSIIQAGEIAKKLKMKVIYSGGIMTANDIAIFSEMHLQGLILGKTLYNQKISLAEAIKTARRGE